MRPRVLRKKVRQDHALRDVRQAAEVLVERVAVLERWQQRACWDAVARARSVPVNDPDGQAKVLAMFWQAGFEHDTRMPVSFPQL